MNDLRRGQLIVIEGANGAGKSTIIEEICKYFTIFNIEVSVYKFPNRYGKHGHTIDQYLKGEITIQSKYDILSMFAADRREATANMEKDLTRGKVVICDRYVFSAIAYQIPAHVTKPIVIRNYCNIIGYFDKNMPIPDMVFLIEGDHLSKRGINNPERFHYMGDKALAIQNALRLVVDNYATPHAILKNRHGHLNDIVHYIVCDINLRRC